jgi:pimeloyl-ACP methyl ester carboxylesterase
MKRPLFAAVLIVGLVASAPAAHPAAATATVEVDIGDGPGPANLIVFLPGSGCAPVINQASTFFHGLAGHWRIVALEKPGLDKQLRMGCTPAFHAATDYPALIDRQSRFAADMLAAFPDAPKKVLVGYSEGGTVAGFVAARIPGFTHLIVAAAGAMPGEMESRVSFTRMVGAAAAARLIADIKAAPEALDRFAFGDTYRYWASLFALEPMQAYRTLRLPILMVHGERDGVVPVETTRYAAAEFAAAGLTNLTVRYLPDAGHGLYGAIPAKRAEIWAGARAWLDAAP